MKKFTKRLALLLVLAMVVTLVPAKSAAAASIWSFAVSDEVYNVKDTVKLEKNQFIDIDLLYDGEPVDSSVYKVAYVSSDESVLWIDAKNGKARADKNGAMKTATGKATVSAQIENLITGAKAERVLYVEVSEKAVANAASVAISNLDAFAEQFGGEALAIGAEFDFDSKMYDAAGNAVTFADTNNYRGWYSSDETIATVGLTDGVMKTVAGGEVKITVSTYASKEDRAANKNAIKSDSITILVATDDLKAESLNVKSYTEVVVSFNRALTKEEASAISKDDFVVVNETTKVKQILSGVSAKENEKEVTVSLYINLQSKNEYSFKYKDQDAISIVPEIGTVAEVVVKGGTLIVNKETEIKQGKHYFFYDQNGIDITSSVDANDVTVTYESSTNNAYLYQGSDRAISYATIWEKGGQLKVTVTHYTYDYEKGTEHTVTGTGMFIGSDAASSATEQGVRIGDANGNDASYDKAKDTRSVSLSDINKRLYVSLKVVEADGSESTVKSGSDNLDITFESTDIQTLIVSQDGALTPLKTGAVAVKVLYKGQVCTVVTLNVTAKRVFTSFSLASYAAKLSQGVAESKCSFQINALNDQFNEGMTGTISLKLKSKPSASNAALDVPTPWVEGDNSNFSTWGNVKFDGTYADFDAPGTYVYEVTAKVGDKELTRRITISVSEVNTTEIARVDLNTDIINGIDLAFNNSWDGSVTSTVSLYKYDSKGNLLGTVAAGGADGYFFELTMPDGKTKVNNADGLDTTQALGIVSLTLRDFGNGSGIAFTSVSGGVIKNEKAGAVDSGSVIETAKNNANDYNALGTYTVRIFKLDAVKNEWKLYTQRSFVVKNSQTAPVVTTTGITVSSKSDIASKIQAKLNGADCNVYIDENDIQDITVVVGNETKTRYLVKKVTVLAKSAKEGNWLEFTLDTAFSFTQQ